MEHDGDRGTMATRFAAAVSGDMAPSLFAAVMLLAILFGLDVATTTMVLSLGGTEGNLLMAGIAHLPFLHLLIKGLTMIAITLVVRWADTIVRGIGLYPLTLVIVVYAAVVVHNVTILLVLQG